MGRAPEMLPTAQIGRVRERLPTAHLAAGIGTRSWGHGIHGPLGARLQSVSRRCPHDRRQPDRFMSVVMKQPGPPGSAAGLAGGESHGDPRGPLVVAALSALIL